MPFTAQGFTSVTNSLSKRPRSGHVPGLHQRDRHVHGVDAGVAAEVIGDVLADADDAVARGAAGRSWLRSGRRSRDRRGRPAWRAPGRRRAPRRATSSRSCAGSSVEARMTSGRKSRSAARSRRGGWRWSPRARRRRCARSARRRPPAVDGVTPRAASSARYCSCSALAEDADPRHHAALVPARGQRLDRAAGWICRRRRGPDSRASSGRAECASVSRSPRVQPLQQQRALLGRERFDGDGLGRWRARRPGAARSR